MRWEAFGVGSMLDAILQPVDAETDPLALMLSASSLAQITLARF